MSEMYRQGDVFIMRIDEIPDGVRPVKRDGGRVVLAYGEVTGHAHAISAPEADLFETFTDGVETAEAADRFLRTLAPVSLSHEEHDTIVLPPGNYLIRHQREYSPREVRWVAD